MTTFQPNDLILNNTYRVERLLGRGAFGEVYLVTHLQLRVHRAVKVVRCDELGLGSTEFAEYRERFTLEARIGASFQHENIIRVHDFREENGILFLVMDYAPRGSLEDQIENAIRAKTFLSVEQVVQWIAEAANGLAEIHRRDYVHRDVKPSNLLLTADNRVCVADLGLVQLPTSRSRGSSFLQNHPGTPEYMPPEQRPGNGMPLFTSADVYALGCVFFELLTLKKYYHRPEGTRASSLRKDIPAWVDEIVARSLSPDARERFENAGEFLTAIQRRSAFFDRRRSLPSTKHVPWTILLAGVFGLILIGTFVYVLSAGIPSSQSSATQPQPTAWVLPSSAPVLPTDSSVEGAVPVTETVGLTLTPLPSAVTAVQPSNTAATTWRQGKIAYMTNQNSQSNLNILDLSTNSTYQVASSSSDLNYLGLAFSADGSRLAYYALPKRLNVISASENSSPAEIATCQSPSFSSDGTKILCVSSQLELTLIDSQSGGALQTISQSHSPSLAALSSTGWIAYASFSGDSTQIWETSINGGDAKLLAGSASENYAPAWSPDGNFVAYQSNDGSANSEIWVMDKDGSNKRQITHTANSGWSRAPSWSPDGRYLAYVSSQNGSQGADEGDVFIVSLTDGSLQQVTSTGGTVYDWRVAWGR